MTYVNHKVISIKAEGVPYFGPDHTNKDMLDHPAWLGAGLLEALQELNNGTRVPVLRIDNRIDESFVGNEIKLLRSNAHEVVAGAQDRLEHSILVYVHVIDENARHGAFRHRMMVIRSNAILNDFEQESTATENSYLSSVKRVDVKQIFDKKTPLVFLLDLKIKEGRQGYILLDSIAVDSTLQGKRLVSPAMRHLAGYLKIHFAGYPFSSTRIVHPNTRHLIRNNFWE